MTRTANHLFAWPGVSTRPVRIWVLAPHIATNDENIDYYYDFSQSIDEYTRVFESLQLDWKWQPVTMNDFKDHIQLIENEKNNGSHFPLVLNLCDGDEINDTPGVSVIEELQKRQLIYTGADEAFYRITTSKIPMKEAFDAHCVDTPKWKLVDKNTDAVALFQEVGSPLIIKPAISGGSMGVGVKNVVEDKDALLRLMESMEEGYRGWNLLADGLIAEAFINGPEYTVLICGDHTQPDNIRVYDPVERVFHSSLPDKEKFLSFERLWEIYETESAMPGNDNFYEYRQIGKDIAEEIKQLTKAAFLATNGVGYARADIRGDKNNGKLYMLEINAQCGISEDENFTSIGAILRYGQVGFHQLVFDILQEAMQKHHSLVLAEQQRTLSSQS